MSNPSNERFPDHRYIHPSPGVGAVGQYQLSGIPFATASVGVQNVLDGEGSTEISFPYVTKFVTVVNEHSGASAKLRVGFSSAGTSGSLTDNYFLLDNGESYTGEFRVSKIFLAGHESNTTASVIAGMTGIPSAKLVNNWSGTSGVG